MIATETIAILMATAVVMAFMATLYFWCEHNKKNDETFATNPLKVKWVIGGLLGGAMAGGIVLAFLIYMPEMAWQEAVAKFGAVTGAFGVILAKCVNEGISMTAKWAVQKTQKVVEAVNDPEVQALREQVGDLTSMMNELMKSLKGSS